MKTTPLFLALSLLAASLSLARGADEPTALLQRGLLEEEANHNLEAAIKTYQAVVAQFDDQRKLVATAVFRLGECYRKQGRTNEAAAQYGRIILEFADQSTLADLSRQNLTGLGALAKATSLPSGAEPLTSAEAEEVQKIREIIANSPDLINARAGDQGTRLHRAASAGQLSVVRFLLANGADVNATDRNGATALQLAAASGHKAVVEALLAGGAKVQLSESPSTALHFAARNGHKLVITVLLDRGADVNARDKSGCTALHTAVFNHHLAVVELLLERKADPNVASHSDFQEANWGFGTGTTPLHVAASRTDMPLIELLCARGAEVNSRNKSGQTPLHLATGANSKVAVEFLLVHGADANAKSGSTPTQTPLLSAAQSGFAEIVEVLAAHGADVNVRDKDGNSALHWAVLRLAQNEDSEALARAVLAHKPDLESRNRERFTPLQLAVHRGVEKVAALLVEAGADVNVVAPAGETPLFWAVERKMTDTVKLLLEHKANPNTPNLAGRTPLDTVGNWMRSSRTADDPDWLEIDALLRKAGASEEFSRRFFITVTRKARGLSQQHFYKGTNDFNRYTLFELVTTFFQTGAGLPGHQPSFNFVDFAHVKITRLKPEGGTSEFTVDLAAAFKSGVCTDDVPLEWGDVVDFPELDHPLNLGWSGLDSTARDLLRKCLQRKVEIVVKGEPTPVTLRPGFHVYQDERVPKVSEGLVIPAFRLGEVVKNSGLLRSSSDTGRVQVKRTDPETGHKLELVFDLEKSNSSTDLWLRDGDVIEIPERDPNAPPRAASSQGVAVPGSGVIISQPGPLPAPPPRTLPARQTRRPPPPDPAKD